MLIFAAQREDSSKITIQATGATSWRRSDVKYRKNEAFVDVIETVNLLMSKEGKLPLLLHHLDISRHVEG
jgi:AP-2 complex subunit mu-1